MPPEFLTLDEILAIHRDQISRYGGVEGVHDWGMLQSAIAMPAASFGGQSLHTDLYEMAAAYLFHLVQNHPFVDGNKRVGVAAALVFLKLNGITIHVTTADLVKTVLGVAQGKIGKAAAADFFRKGTRK
jgi:death on curing protein